ncbi:MAG: SAM-dependent methyltransferase [Planctomycetia bacterium]|nr:SAM-dependent methyltransferase [Planctomycetia bacterium]
MQDIKTARFIYTSCQLGAENALKGEMARKRPDYHISFSRPGFLTWKIADEAKIDNPRLVFARTFIHSLGKISNKNFPLDRKGKIRETWNIFTKFLLESKLCSENEPFQTFRLHVWSPDSPKTGSHGVEPGPKTEDLDLHNQLWRDLPVPLRRFAGYQSDLPESAGKEQEICLDCVRLSDEEWWLGWHRVEDLHSAYAGGLLPLALPEDASSRAWLKFEEGLRWSNFPIGIGSRCVDIGAAPGGGSQVLLSRGAEVLGVDPAEMDPQILANPNFTHLRGKIHQLKRNLFRKSRWFIADMNVAPSYTLDVFEEIVMREDIAARGLLFTLKFFNWKLANELPDFIRRIKSWGFNHVQARQLQFNRQEIMIAAIKKPFRR